MSLRSEIVPFIDGNGYVAPNPVATGVMRASDNGPMFSSEYYILLDKRQEDRYTDAEDWEVLMERTTIVPGVTVRAPGDTAKDTPDNIIARLAAAKVLRMPRTAKEMLDYGIKHYGFFNTENPNHILTKQGKLDLAYFIWRQPQLYVACLTAANALKWRHLPLVVLTALVIATSCLIAHPSDSDSRRLNWLLIQAIGNDSILCRLAAIIWKRRLFKTYPRGMLDVYNLYYKPKGAHPFTKYMAEY